MSEVWWVFKKSVVRRHQEEQGREGQDIESKRLTSPVKAVVIGWWLSDMVCVPRLLVVVLCDGGQMNSMMPPKTQSRLSHRYGVVGIYWTVSPAKACRLAGWLDGYRVQGTGSFAAAEWECEH